MYNQKILSGIGLVCFFISIAACGVKNENKTQNAETEKVNSDSVKYDIFDPDNCLSVSLLKDTVEVIILKEEDSRYVLSYLSSAIYNEERNDTGVKFKITNPDYTFLIELKDGEKELLQLWCDESLLLLKAKWYMIPSQIDVYSRLEKYK